MRGGGGGLFLGKTTTMLHNESAVQHQAATMNLTSLISGPATPPTNLLLSYSLQNLHSIQLYLLSTLPLCPGAFIRLPRFLFTT